MSVTIFVCDLGRDKLYCQSCPEVAAGSCTFELRGKLAGRKCERRICLKCAGVTKMCPSHQRVTALDASKPKPI